MENHLVHAYSQLPIQFERGDGVYLYTSNGDKYKKKPEGWNNNC